METKEFKVIVPDGMEIDKENSTFECIKFKPIKPIKPKRWRDDEDAVLSGYYIQGNSSSIISTAGKNNDTYYNVFATKKQAKSALAMARISQIMANDERFGGVVTDEEWSDDSRYKYCIIKCHHNIVISPATTTTYSFLAFHTAGQRDLFLKENVDLVKDYLMLE